MRIATDGRFLYLRFDAQQDGALTANQRTNDLTVMNGGVGESACGDDAVWVDLWPTGPGGFEYQFEANALGSHNEASSENAGFAP